MPKKFLFVSLAGLISDIAWRTSQEGNEVKFYIDDKTQKDIGSGFVEKTQDWRKELDWADVIVFDDVLGQGAIAEELRAKGKLVIGGTRYTDRLEDDRGFGQEELKKHGISIIPNQNFTSFEDAINFVKKHPGKYVVKPSGESQNIKRILFIGEDDRGLDVIQILEAYKKILSDTVKEFQLQKKVEGVEVGVGAFFNGNQFIYPINVNFEHKRLFPKSIGPLTGEMGTSMFWSMPNKIFNSTLKKLEPKLREENYVGYVDLNCIVNSKGIYPLEFTSRFGYPTIFIQQEGIAMQVGEFLYLLASQEKFKIKTRNGFQVGIRILMPPYPFDDPETFDAYSRNSAIIFKKPNLEGIHIEDAKIVKDHWFVAGDSGVIMTIAGAGATMKQAQNQAYSRVQNIIIPNMYYRTDIGDRWFEDSDKLHVWGYLREI